MQGPGYWIDPDGQIKRLPGGRHIDQMIADPERFGLTRGEIVERYRQAGEPLGLEGCARRQLIGEAIERGFIHIRHQLRQGWRVTIWEATPAVLDVLHDWARVGVEELWAGRAASVRVCALRSAAVTLTNIQELSSWTPTTRT
jgi:hypothetical protein